MSKKKDTNGFILNNITTGGEGANIVDALFMEKMHIQCASVGLVQGVQFCQVKKHFLSHFSHSSLRQSK